MRQPARFRSSILAILLGCLSALAWAASTVAAPEQPRGWDDRSLSPDARARLVLARMTQEEKLSLIHGYGGAYSDLRSNFPRSNAGAGFVAGIPRLGVPDLNMADSSVGISKGALRSRYSTLMPSVIAEAASWDTAIAYRYGALIGRELTDQGFNVSLAGGVNLIREPRNGRAFEYRSEDPLLSGVMVGHYIRGQQDQQVIADIKHFAFNDQETGRLVHNVEMDRRVARETDLLAFEIGLRIGDPGMVMCSYNKFEGVSACESRYLMTEVLKRDWGFKGFVISDWGGVHSAAAFPAGLDQEQPTDRFFGAPLRQALTQGDVDPGRLDDAAVRILRTIFAVGVYDKKTPMRVVDVAAGLVEAQAVAERGMVLLKNERVLPLRDRRQTVLLIGSHADVGVLTGGGSGQVDPPGGSAVKNSGALLDLGAAGIFELGPIWHPSSPQRALQAALPKSAVLFDDGSDVERATKKAATADVVIVFASQPSMEGADQKSLRLPGEQDALIDAVATANRRTLVVLETSGPVSMPWAGQVKAIIEAWYPGARGGEALANLMTGRVNFSGRLPVTFAAADADLPNPIVPGSDLAEVGMTHPDGRPILDLAGKQRMSPPPFDTTYPEGEDFGYRWFERTNKAPLFPFGFGLSYSTFRYRDFEVSGEGLSVKVRNVSSRAGTETVQVYANLPARYVSKTRRLVGWAQVSLAPGQEEVVSLPWSALHLGSFNSETGVREVIPGEYRFAIGSSSRDLYAEKGWKKLP